MGRPTTVVVAGVSASNWVPLDRQIAPFEIGYQVVVAGSGTATYSIQHTLDDVANGGTATAFDVVSAKTINSDGSLKNPSSAIRLSVTATSAPATVTATFLQSGVV